jgi:molybdate transport system regulatory protein
MRDVSQVVPERASDIEEGLHRLGEIQEDERTYSPTNKIVTANKITLSIGRFPMAQAQVSIRIDLESGGRIGPGKIALLEAIRKTGSITAAAQSMQMSYRRAWLLVDELNKLLSEPVVTTAVGGVMRGGTIVTPVGEKTIALYHSIEAHTRAAARSEFQAFWKLIRD